MTAGSTPDLDRLLAHADWVRRLSRQLCRDEHAAADAAQETLLLTMQSPPRHAGNLRGFFARTLRNVLRARARGGRRVGRREALAASRGAEMAEAAADVAARAELHQFLGQCVLGLPEPQRTLVLWHYFDGEEVAAIARRSAMTTDAVRGHLRRARATLRGRLQRSDGDVRRGFGLLLAANRPAAGLLGITTLGLTMKMKAAAALLVATLGVLLWSQWPPPDPGTSPRVDVDATAVAQGDLGAAGAAASQKDVDRVAVPAPPDPATTGALHVRVMWPDGSPAADLRVTVETSPGTRFGPEHSVVTGEDGTALASGLLPGKGQLRVQWRGAQFTIVAGQVAEAEVQLRPGVDVHGIVVDGAGQPVRTARVWLSRFNDGDEGEELGPVAGDGTFVVRAVPPQGFFVAAIAAGRRNSTLTAVQGMPDTIQQVRIELDEPGASLLGRVFLADGTPAAGARVLVGQRSELAWHRESVWRYHRPAMDTRCDERGHFRTDGLPLATDIDVWLVAEGNAALRQSVNLSRAGEHAVTFSLRRGATVRGTATGPDGGPVADAWIAAFPERIGALRSDGRFIGPAWILEHTVTAKDGSYTLPNITAGAVRLNLRQDTPRRIATVTRELSDGDDVIWNPGVDAGATIAGTVVDEAGNPLVGWNVESVAAGPDATRRTVTDAQGHFELTDCGEGARRVDLLAPGAHYKFATVRKLGVLGGTHDLRFVVSQQAVPSSTLVGSVRRPDGVGRALLHIMRVGTLSHEVAPVEADGTFRIGLLPAGLYRACATCEVDRHTTWSEPFDLRAGETHDLGALGFGPTGSVVATVRDAAGELLDGVQCHVIDSIEGFDLIVAAGRTAAGIVQFAPVLNPGTYRLRVVDRDQPVVNASFTITADTQTAVALTVPASMPCVLRIAPTSEGGLQPMSFCWSRHGEVLLQHTDWVYGTEDRLLRRRLVPGNYELTITSATGNVEQNRFTIAANGPAGREILIRQP